MKTSDVIKWGIENHSNRAERNARELANEGKIFRMSKDNKEFMFGKIREEVWVV